MLDDIKENFEIDEKEAIIIKEICVEVSRRHEIIERITENRNNENYLKTRAKPKVQDEVKDRYIERQMWEKLKDPMYVKKGGIISLMGNTIISNVLMRSGS